MTFLLFIYLILEGKSKSEMGENYIGCIRQVNIFLSLVWTVWTRFTYVLWWPVGRTEILLENLFLREEEM